LTVHKPNKKPSKQESKQLQTTNKKNYPDLLYKTESPIDKKNKIKKNPATPLSAQLLVACRLIKTSQTPAFEDCRLSL
jgi:hypothetical protein